MFSVKLSTQNRKSTVTFFIMSCWFSNLAQLAAASALGTTRNHMEPSLKSKKPGEFHAWPRNLASDTLNGWRHCQLQLLVAWFLLVWPLVLNWITKTKENLLIIMFVKSLASGAYWWCTTEIVKKKSASLDLQNHC